MGTLAAARLSPMQAGVADTIAAASTVDVAPAIPTDRGAVAADLVGTDAVTAGAITADPVVDDAAGALANAPFPRLGPEGPQTRPPLVPL